MSYRTLLLSFIFLLLTKAGIGHAVDHPALNGDTALTSPPFIIVFVGDGMGRHQRGLATALLRAQTNNDNALLHMDQMEVSGSLTTWLDGNYITDSAAAGTAMFSGQLTGMGVLGMDIHRQRSLESVLDWALASNRRVGVISDVSLDHATPAAIYAHQKSRHNYSAIVDEMMTSGVYFFGGGGLKASHGKTDPTLMNGFMENGYRIVSSRESLQQVDNKSKVYAKNIRLDKGAALLDAEMLHEKDMDLAFLTQQALRLLTPGSADEHSGFFLMVEGGKIDWKGHANEPFGMAQQILAMDQAVGVALEFAVKHPDQCLVIVTADHETGDLQHVPDERNDARILLQQHGTSWQTTKASLLALDPRTPGVHGEISMILDKSLGLTDVPEEDLATVAASLTAIKTADSKKQRRQARQALNHQVQTLLAYRLGYQFTSGGHSNQPVPLTATGPAAERFAGQQRIHMFGRHLRDILLTPSAE